jgi:aldehyde dehydrogenase (NAD+)
VREPAGVVGAITPWNFPLEVILNKVGQALATGNTMVLKPAPDTPFNATRLAKLVAEQTDIPAGVFYVVTSSDHLVGEELTLSPKVDLISFTGSTAVGRRIMSKGGRRRSACSSSWAASPPRSCSRKRPSTRQS